jgi:hypothetical protein
VEAFGYLERVNPELTREDIIAARVACLRYAQPVCEPGFAAKIPPVETSILDLQIADTIITLRKTGESRRAFEWVTRCPIVFLLCEESLTSDLVPGRREKDDEIGGPGGI